MLALVTLVLNFSAISSGKRTISELENHHLYMQINEVNVLCSMVNSENITNGFTVVSPPTSLPKQFFSHEPIKKTRI